MSNIYDSLEEKLYRANFSSEHSRQQAYLAVHATLFKNKQTPRIYVPDKPLDEKSLENILAHLLLCDIDNLIEDTNKYLTKLGTSTKTLLSLNNADKEELVELIEDLLLNGWGQGKILYDHLRVVPNEDCELLNFIDSQPISTGDKYHKILNTLRKRQDDSIENQNALNNIFSKGHRKYNPTILCKSYQMVLNKLWVNNWASPNNYKFSFDEDSILSSLVFTEEL